jgi:hypothetical protein
MMLLLNTLLSLEVVVVARITIRVGLAEEEVQVVIGLPLDLLLLPHRMQSPWVEVE